MNANSSSEAYEPADPETIVVAFPRQQNRSIRAFRYCYLDREELLEAGQPPKKLCNQLVNPQSLCSKRCNIVARWIGDLVTGSINRVRANYITRVFNWIDQNDRNQDLYDGDSAKQLYTDYTKHLLQMTGPHTKGSPKHYKPAYAESLQTAMKDVIGYATGLSRDVIGTWDRKLNSNRQKHRDSINHFKQITTTELVAGSEIKAADLANPEVIVVRFADNRCIPAYRYCYLDREELQDGVKPARLHYELVNPNSLCPRRCEIVARWIKAMVTRSIGRERARTIIRIFNWIDQNGRCQDLYDGERVKQLYTDYTKHLLQMTAPHTRGFPKHYKPAYAESLQTAMKDVIGYATGLNRDVIGTWDRKLNSNRQKHRDSINHFKQITTTELVAGSEIKAADLANPEVIVVRFADNRCIPAYRYCYLDREELQDGVKPARQYYELVNPNSLCPRRCEIVARWIKAMVTHSIGKDRARKIIRIFNWVDQNGRCQDLYDGERVKQLYCDFTNHLMLLINSSTGSSANGFSTSYAHALQAALKDLIGFAIGQPRNVIGTWAKKIESRPRQKDTRLDRFKTITTSEIIVGSEFRAAEPFNSEEVVVRYVHPHQVIRAYRYCYLDRAQLLEGVESTDAIQLINPHSLCQKRSEVVTRWINDMINGSFEYGRAQRIGPVFDWIDYNKRNGDLFDEEKVKQLYLDFTHYLFQMITPSKDEFAKEFTAPYAASLQAALRSIINYATHQPRTVIETWAAKPNTQKTYRNLSRSSLYTEIATTKLIADSVDKNLVKINPERTIVCFPSNRNLTLFAYRYCYLDRANLVSEISSTAKYSNRVNPDSLCKKRCEVVSRWINDMITGSFGYGRAQRIGPVFDWVDKNKRNDDLFDSEAAKQLYGDYSNYLLHQTRLSKVGPKKGLAHSTAQNKQAAFTDLIHYATGKPQSLIRSWAHQITSAGNTLPQPRLDDQEAQLAFEMHRRFFWAYSDITLNNEKAPLVVNLQDLGFENFVAFGPTCSNYNGWGAQGESPKSKWRDFAFSEDGFDSDWQSVESKASTHGFKLQYSPTFHTTKRNLRYNDNHCSSGSLRAFANRAVKHFGYLLLFASGCNADHLDGIDFTQAQLAKGDGFNRIIAFKDRCTNERQKLSVSREFLKDWRQFVRLRAWMEEFYGQSIPDYGLLVVPTKGRNKDSFVALNSLSISTGLSWPDQGPELTTRSARKIKVQKSLEFSDGNISLVSGMISNKEQTLRKHYGFKKVEESAKQLSRFFDGMHRSANLRVSRASTVPVVKDGYAIPPGKCVATSTNDRGFIDGIDESRAPELNCGAPLSCLFCKSFGIRKDYGDIHRLLSVAAYVKFQSRHKSQNINAHGQKFLPVIARIEEIIDVFAQIDETSRNITSKAKKAIENGDLDPFWLAQINAVLDAMEDI